MANDRFDHAVFESLRETAQAVGKLLESNVWNEVVKRAWAQDVDGLAELLDQAGLGRRCFLVCRYLCIKRCDLVCLRLCGPPELTQEPSLRGLQEFARAIGRIGSDERILVPLVKSIETQNANEFKRLVEELELQSFCHLLCYWICSVQCGLYCDLVCEPKHIGRIVAPSDPVAEVREASLVVGKLAAQKATLKELYEAVQTHDVERAQKAIEQAGLLEHCTVVCNFVCTWECFWLCRRLCRDLPIAVPADPVAEIQEFGRVTVTLAQKGALEKLHARVAAGDEQGFRAVVAELRLERFCYQICRWICVLRCRWYCTLVCPPVCELLEPAGCVEEREFTTAEIFRGIEIRGTAAGFPCDHYTLEWREAGAPTWRSDWIQYAGPDPTQGTCGVIADTLGYLKTYPAVPDGPVEIRLCVYSTPTASPSCCTITFELSRDLVWISGIEGIAVATPPGLFDPSAQLIDGDGIVRSFGTKLRIFGTAWVGGCELRKIKRYTLSYHGGFVTDPTLPGFVEFWQVDFTLNPFQEAYRDTDPVHEEALTSIWKRLRVPVGSPPVFVTIANYLWATRWNTRIPELYRVEPVDPPATPSPPTWTSTPLPLPNCQSGRYTLRLSVEDTTGTIKHDLQQAWFDNKTLSPTHAKISQIAGVPACEVINLSQFAVDDGDCSEPWPAQLLGIAYDEYIEEGNTTRPSDNFGGYRVWVKKDGAPNPGSAVPIPGPGGPPWGGPFVGTTRVGTPRPADRCPTPVPPPGVLPPETPGILALLDMRRFDAVCNPAQPVLTLKRGECCNYVFHLLVWDTTICPEENNDRHERWHSFPMRICNDLG